MTTLIILFLAAILFIPLILVLVSLLKLQAHLRKIKAQLPDEYLYFTTNFRPLPDKENIYKEIKNGRLNSFGDKTMELANNYLNQQKYAFRAGVFFIIVVLIIFIFLGVSNRDI